jgi:hypothetical protein
MLTTAWSWSTVRCTIYHFETVGHRLILLGPQITSSTNNFRAVDPYNSGAWTTIQADEAEQDIKDFLNQFPLSGIR